MIEHLKDFVTAYENRIKTPDVIEHLSYNVWKTCYRIFEEVQGTPDLINTHIRVLIILHRLYLLGIVQCKKEIELTEREQIFAEKAISRAEFQLLLAQASYGFPTDLYFYRLQPSNLEKSQNPVMGFYDNLNLAEV